MYISGIFLPREVSMKKVLCIVDSYRWALHNRAVALKLAYKGHKFDIKHFRDLKKVRFENYNIVYSLNWPIHGYISSKIADKRRRRYRLVTGISSHIGHPSDRKFAALLSNYDAVGTSNKFLYNSFKKKFPKTKIIYTPFGVDCSTFCPTTDPAKFSNIFGWVGNPDRPVKRFSEIKKCIKSLGNEVELVVATNKTNYSRLEMAKFYNRIGTLICFSESEGTPNPVLEAAACGRNVISTKVGNVPELFQGLADTCLVRDEVSLEEAMRRAVANPKMIASAGRQLAARAELEWSWNDRARLFEPLLGLRTGSGR